MNLPEAISARIEPEPNSGCWLWSGMSITGTNSGAQTYGRIYGSTVGPPYKPDSQYLAHRVVYELLVGPIRDGLEIDHLCRVGRCVNPRHLEAVPHRVNILRGRSVPARNAAKNTCPQGHPFDVILPNGRRACRVCLALHDRNRDKAKKAAYNAIYHQRRRHAERAAGTP